MIRPIISKCSKQTQKEYKTRHDWVGKVIHWELCKKMELDHTTKWYMHKPESIAENELHKILWDFEIQTDHLIPARRPDLVQINKKRKKKRNKYLDLVKEQKKAMEHESDGHTNCNWSTWNNP